MSLLENLPQNLSQLKSLGAPRSRNDNNYSQCATKQVTEEKRDYKQTNLHGERDEVLSLKLREDGDEVGLEQPRDVGLDEPVEPDRIGVESLELFGHHQPFLPHLLLPSPYRQARARRRTGDSPCEMVRGIY